jgi:PAS domain S-box-containing protein/putative nucleotidyltransferase with HDIG domain
MKILIADDLAINLKLLRAQLEAEGNEVFEADDGVAALEILEKESAFDVIISDILMPRMDGYRLITEVRKSKVFGSVPIIVYTATYTSPADEKLSLELGADYYLRKPASVAKINEAIKQATTTRRQTTEIPVNDVDVMKVYNEVLIRKLEEKLLELGVTQQGLKASEDRYRMIAETAEEGIWTIDADERTTYVNPKVASMFGYEPQEMLVGSLFDFMSPASARLARAGLTRRRTEKMTDMFDFKFRRKDGSDFWAMVASKPIQNEAGEHVGALAMITDINDRKLAEQTLQKTLEKLGASEKHNRSLYESSQKRLSQTIALREIDKAISGSLDLKFTLDIVLAQVMNELQVDAADILLYDSIQGKLEFFVGKGFRGSSVTHANIPADRGFASDAILSQKRIDVADLRKEANNFFSHTNVSEEEFVDFHCVPLVAKGKVLGLLGIFKRSIFDAGPEWLNFLETLAGQAAIAIDNISLFDGMQKANQDLMLGYNATIEGWSRALDLRDKETEGHTQRVTKLTMHLASAMGLDEEQLLHIRRGALLHDIGKMGVPDNILLKPDKLTEEEWAVMKMHPIHAYDMLYPILYLRESLAIPFSHHEKWDGSGYPQGLRAEAIPFAARIFAVADVYDALISDRPYRKAWSQEKALDYIKEASGTHFDPRVVAAFLETIPGAPRLINKVPTNLALGR